MRQGFRPATMNMFAHSVARPGDAQPREQEISTAARSAGSAHPLQNARARGGASSAVLPGIAAGRARSASCVRQAGPRYRWEWPGRGPLPREEPLDGAPPWSLISDQGFPIEARRVLAIGPGAWWRDGVRPTPKYPAPANTLNRAGLRCRHHGTGGGPSETDVSELMVIPAGLPSGGMAVLSRRRWRAGQNCAQRIDTAARQAGVEIVISGPPVGTPVAVLARGESGWPGRKIHRAKNNRHSRRRRDKVRREGQWC